MTENYKVRVDPSTGAVEAEGSEAFVREMLERFTTGVGLPQAAGIPKPKRPAGAKPKKSVSDNSSGPKKKGRAVVKEDEDLQKKLTPKSQELDKFLKARSFGSRVKEAAAIAYFLSSELGTKPMSVNEYYTALRVLGIKLPKDVAQVLRDGIKEGIFFRDNKAYALTPSGINVVEHYSLKAAEGKKTK